MKNTRKIIVGLLLAAGIATAGTIAYAQAGGFGPGWGGYGPGMMGGGHGPGMMGGGYGPGYGPGMMGGYGRGYGPGAVAGAWGDPAAYSANLDARLAAMKTELNITANQETAWQAYVAQAKTQLETMQAMHAAAAAAATQTVPERLSLHTEFMKQRTAHLEAMSTALNSLYTVLTTEQRTIADQYFGGGARLAQGKQFGPGRGR